MTHLTVSKARGLLRAVCVIACRLGSGSSTFLHYHVSMRKNQFDRRDYLDAVKRVAEANGYDVSEAIVFERNSGPAWLFKAIMYEVPPIALDISTENQDVSTVSEAGHAQAPA